MRTRPLARLVLLLVFSLATCAANRAQDPGKILDQYIKATGGSRQTLQTANPRHRRLSNPRLRRKNRHFHLRFQISQSLLPGTHRRRTARNPRLQRKIRLASLRAQNAAAQRCSVRTRSSSKPPPLSPCSHLLNLKKNKIGAAFVGPAKIGSRDALEIEFTMPTGVKRQFYFDSSSHLLLKESGLTGGVAAGNSLRRLSPRKWHSSCPQTRTPSRQRHLTTSSSLASPSTKPSANAFSIFRENPKSSFPT